MPTDSTEIATVTSVRRMFRTDRKCFLVMYSIEFIVINPNHPRHYLKKSIARPFEQRVSKAAATTAETNSVRNGLRLNLEAF